MPKPANDIPLGPIQNTEWTVLGTLRKDDGYLYIQVKCSCGTEVAHQKSKMQSISRPRMCAACTRAKGKKFGLVPRKA